MRARRIYCLKLTLVKNDGSIITDANGLRLAGARQAISRELLADEDMCLYELHVMIQRLFGWKNIHLHKFSLMQEDFSRITCGRCIEAYKELCGVLFMCGGDPFGFRWNWHELFKDMPYGRLEEVGYGIPAKESYCVNQYLAGQPPIFNAETRREISVWTDMITDEECDDTEHVPAHMANILLERIRLNEILLPSGNELSEPDDTLKLRTELWRKQLSEQTAAIGVKISNLHKQNPNYCEDMYRVFREFRTAGADFMELMRIKPNEERVRKVFGVDYETARIAFRDKFIKLNREAYDLINNYNPKIEPLFDSLLYSYDCGDEWCVKIECSAIYIRRQSLQGVYEGQKKATWRDTMGFIPPVLLHLKLEKAVKLNEPLCIYSDGDSLIEEIGGVEGYFRFLKNRAAVHA